MVRENKKREHLETEWRERTLRETGSKRESIDRMGGEREREHL